MTFNHRVCGSNPQWYTICSVGQEVKTLPFHGSNTSSSLVPSTNADMAEQADARDLKSLDTSVVWVQVPLSAPYAPLAQLVRAHDL